MIMKARYKVYLSGPISGLDFNTAVSWTNYAKHELEYRSATHIEGYRPLRGKSFLSKEKDPLSVMGDSSNAISSPKGIVGRDRYDVMTSDVILVNLLGAKERSIGTMFEVAWAFLLQKPIILVMEKEGNVHQHAFLLEAVTYWVYDLEHALSLTHQLLIDE